MDPVKQDQWLGEHVPHRLRACLTGLPLQEELMPPDANEQVRANIRMRCLGNAAWEGRLAGMRWLIEFVGIVYSRGKPDRPNRREADIAITQLAGGLEIDLLSPEAAVLANIWKGCSQASGHPTQDSNHPAVDDKALDAAMRIIVSHLNKTIYAGSESGLASRVMIPFS